jgi:hypothetical protein
MLIADGQSCRKMAMPFDHRSPSGEEEGLSCGGEAMVWVMNIISRSKKQTNRNNPMRG